MSPLDFPELLWRHNPVLVLFPQDLERRIRPGARRWPGSKAWGDYHPCSAEFFLERVHQRDEPEPWSLSGLVRLLRWRKPRRTEYAQLQDKLRDLVIAGRQAETRHWELDLADVPSQDEGRAWKAYGALLNERSRHPYECVVYGRWQQSASGPTLQYWYLYLYNDFWNNHEADWEIVTIALAHDGSPQRVCLSCHRGGSAMMWQDAPKSGERPVVHVGRGSHAGYFSYRRDGYDPIDIVRHIHLPALLRFLEPLVQRIPPLPFGRDFPPADPQDPFESDAPSDHRGERVEPALRIMPGRAPAPGSPDWPAWWWLNYQGKWGSWHSRIAGTIGVDSPWAPVGNTKRWDDPVRWATTLDA